MDELFDVMIIGAGAAGLTAGIYSSRAKHSTLILNEGAVGGQMVLTNEIANYPGVELTQGYSLANTMKKQAKAFGCKIKSNIRIREYSLEGAEKKVVLDDGREFSAKTVILALGGKPRPLEIPGEEEFYCDFYLPDYDLYIEYWGGEGEEQYERRKREKREQYRRHGLKLFEIHKEDDQRLPDILRRLLNMLRRIDE